MIRKAYGAIGYVGPDTTDQEIESHVYSNRDDAVTVLAANDAGLSVGTVSAITDAKNILPMDEVYGAELQQLRADGFKTAEIRRFAVDTEQLQDNKLDLSIELLGIALKFIFLQQCDYVCFMISPAHKVFYESLGCVPFGEERPCPAISGRPVVAYILDIRQIRKGEGTTDNFLLDRILSVSADILL